MRSPATRKQTKWAGLGARGPHGETIISSNKAGLMIVCRTKLREPRAHEVSGKRRTDGRRGRKTPHIFPYRATGNAQHQIGERFLRAWQGGGRPYSLHDYHILPPNTEKGWPKWPSRAWLENYTPGWGGLSQRVLTRVAAHHTHSCAWKVGDSGHLLQPPAAVIDALIHPPSRLTSRV